MSVQARQRRKQVRHAEGPDDALLERHKQVVVAMRGGPHKGRRRRHVELLTRRQGEHRLRVRYKLLDPAAIVQRSPMSEAADHRRHESLPRKQAQAPVSAPNDHRGAVRAFREDPLNLPARRLAINDVDGPGQIAHYGRRRGFIRRRSDSAHSSSVGVTGCILYGTASLFTDGSRGAAEASQNHPRELLSELDVRHYLVENPYASSPRLTQGRTPEQVIAKAKMRPKQNDASLILDSVHTRAATECARAQILGSAAGRSARPALNEPDRPLVRGSRVTAPAETLRLAPQFVAV